MNDITPPRPVGRQPQPQPMAPPPQPKRMPAPPAAPADPPPQARVAQPQPPRQIQTDMPDDFPPIEPPEQPPQPQQPEKPKKKRSLKWLWISLAVLLVLLAATAVAAAWWYNDNLRAVSISAERISFKVEEGDSTEDVARKLKEAGLVRDAFALTVYMKLNKLTDVKTGSYVLMPSQTPKEIVDWLIEGRVDTMKVTILPGQTLTRIKERLVRDGFEAEEVDAAFQKTYDHPLFDGRPAGSSLEGYIFPETYFVSSDITAEQLFVVTFNEFYKQIERTGLKEELASKNLNLYQGITLASIIEREVPAKDQRQVSQVFHRRLAINMPLGADATYKYAAAKLGVEPTAELDSPYNTRIHTGLPPGPIANVPITALDATAKPADGSYLYFVSGDDGVTYFARTLAEHEANISKYCKELCSRW